MKLYRPVGLYEMEKILRCGGKEFPPRLPEQPIFYPVINSSYAKQIAKKWNLDDSISGFAGFITEFDIDDAYINNYEVHCVGSDEHREYWIPAKELEEFNQNIIGGIKIIEAFYGEQYTGIKSSRAGGFKEESLNEQIDVLEKILEYNVTDFSGTVLKEWKLINLNLLYWENTLKYNADVIKSIYDCLKANDKLFIKRYGEGRN